MIFIDEIDSLVPARGGGLGEPQVTERVVNTILSEMDGLEELQSVVLIGATGDLSRRKLLPGLFHLSNAGFIPGCRIIGVSLDSIERLNDFSADPDYCAGKFPVASDKDGKISRAELQRLGAVVEDGLQIAQQSRQRAALAEPLLAICRGFQELNVAMGGTLDQRIQDLPGRMDHSTPADQALPGCVDKQTPDNDTCREVR